MAVAIASSNTANNSNVFTKPSGLADGDVLEIRYGSYGGSSGSPTAPAGFTSVVSSSRAQGGGFMSWGIFRKVITSASGEPASYTVGRPPGTIGWDGGEIDRLTGVDTTTPETDSGSAEAGSGSTMSTGAAVDAGADDLLLLIGINNGQSMTNPSGTTQDFELDGGDFEGWHASPGALSGATYTSTLGASTEWAIAWVVVKAAASLAYEQEGFRWRNDDGSESAATWAATQDTDITAAAGEARRLRMLTNVSGDAPSEGLKLQYRKAGTSEWKDILRQGL